MKAKLITVAVSVACAAAMLPTSNPAFAQAPAAQTTPAATRAEIKAERDEFFKTHEWVDENWQLKGASKKPAAGKPRAEIKTERDAFLKENKWDPQTDSWVSIKATPRDVSKMSRADVKAEAAEFARTYEWDDASGKYIPRKTPLRAKKK